MAKSETKQTLPAIGILGGTFDPVHFGHLRPALEVAQQLNLDQVRLIPCSVPPHRPQPEAAAKARQMMLELAIKGLEGFVVDDRELQREGASYTVDTLLSLREQFPDNPLFVMMGTDAFASIDSWSRWQQIVELAHIVIMQRPEEPLNFSEPLQRWFDAHQPVEADRELAAGKIWLLPVTQLAISATQIRQCFAENRNARFLLPESVIALIQHTGLYGNKTDL